MDENDLTLFLQTVDRQFPTVIGCDLNGTAVSLKRRIHYIEGVGDDDDESHNKIMSYPGGLPPLPPTTDDNPTAKEDNTCERCLRIFLEILDNNLGPVYARLSRKIYGNSKHWRENKWLEMLSAQLVYVSYWVSDSEPVLYTSFMLTEENGISSIESTDRVVYLYEIQLIEAIRRQKLGQAIVSYLTECALESPEVAAVALTVFSDNEKALKFYERLNFTYTIDSPRDEVTEKPRRRTAARTALDPARDSDVKVTIKKPTYYLLYLEVVNHV
ncbi:N-terminal L-serine N(alpha)-acetyltransferase NatD KNAG_0C05820 [Huiozyma naganishii CBS 8797]|uniref:N-alpha-acetyltransferase 40 n=1 Tax=Huiozyma naganishii (strain ATCC MYA-139 / BCRC 22969 / CBS 8797 / KCTC 17520 / NBRC 10181 / NCYC 3082 / Yp74L-3) TaxID=1071383 RepID=J7R4A7_HUIN7|nr:hypothetical protein KNAG_0C05820 [Kazachstania naganishii CBS 8797]CCK69680.1 hypothetical protein KNAG_0C05820 [Kazachstania naganishii CBS 8797]